MGFCFLFVTCVIFQSAIPLYAEQEIMSEPVYQFTVTTIDGETVSLNQYKGKVLLIVNTASRCGFTKQYNGLQALQERFYDQGFRVLGFPSNDFLGQEPGTNEQIKEFCTTKFNVTFDLFSKMSVKGKDQHPLFAYLTNMSGFEGRVTWNFNKFLIDRNGMLVARFGTRTAPLSDEIVEKITTVLEAKDE